MKSIHLIRQLSFVLFWWNSIVHSFVLDAKATADVSIDEKEPFLECFIWLAPSTLEGAGLGMFAGRDFQTDEVLADDLVIPIVDIMAMNEDDPSFTFLWDEYTWNGNSVLMDNEAFFDCDGASPGFGATANSFLPLVNVEEGSPTQDSAGLHRSKDPGVGAFTEYHARSSTATTNIRAGEEFFVDYGGSWFKHREFLGPIPLYEDLRRATQLYSKYKATTSSIAISHPTSAQSTMEEVWDMFIRKTEFPKSRVFGSFHHHQKNELEELDKIGGSVEKLRRQQSSRSVEWLRQHGTCGDHISPGPSTLPQAGRGAIATRDLPVGTIVAQLPLIHLTERRRLDTYPTVYPSGKYRPEPDRNAKKSAQLLLNYCYGHEQSTLLLCPYGPVVNYINHNQTLANVKLQWSSPERGNHMPRLLESPLQELEADRTAKLAMEIVATRTIRKGEEVFLDYGDSWERAWLEHTLQWKPVPGASNYSPARHFNEQEDVLRTVFEEYENPYPSNVYIQCLENFFHPGWAVTDETGEIPIDYSAGGREVDILRYEEDDDGELLYTVVDHDEEELYEGLPRIAFRFLDRPHTTDMFLENAFRHHISIPDEIFPQAWINLFDESTSSS